jgi:hypothetical protein
MTTTTIPQRHARSFTRTPTFEWLARLGYVTRGALYLIIAILAFRLAQGGSSHGASQSGAMHELASQPFGHGLLVAVAVGLAAYAVWRLLEAFVGWTPEAGDHGAVERIGAAGSGVAYGVLCALAISILTGSGGSGSSGGGPQHTTSDVLGWPGGRYLVGVVGLGLLGIAAFQAYRALSKRFLDDAKTGQMSQGVRSTYVTVAVVGLIARGVAFALIGIFIMKAALDYNPQDAVGLDGALHRLLAHSYGTIAVGAVALGLLAFAVYSFADARYRKV